MNEILPISDFIWLPESEIKHIDWTKTNDESEIGYILEVDLLYPENIHINQQDLPLAPEKRKITNNELSEYQIQTLEMMKKFNYKRHPTEKLMLTLHDKKNYVIHYRNLKLYLRLGLVLTKVHRVLSFKQSPWLRSYIQYNTELRKNADLGNPKNPLFD